MQTSFSPKLSDLDKCKYISHDIGFNSRSQFSWTDGSNEKNVNIFGVDNSSSVHIDSKNENILVLGKGPTQGLDNARITAESKYPINFTESGKRFVSNLHYNGSNSFLFVNKTKISQYKAKDSEIKPNSLCLGNISKKIYT